jgi:glycosyltransferase involved in cell wall biosynthesis
MPEVLTLAYYFPPLGGGGVQRTLKFIKYLPEYGWSPVVITVKDDRTAAHDPELAEDVPPQVPVTRTPAYRIPAGLPWRVRNFIRRWLLLVDDEVGWLPFAQKEAQKVIEQRKSIAALYSSSAPYTSHLIGLRLQQKTGLPWIADFRDPWIGNFSSSFPTRWHEQAARRLERKVVLHADRVISVSLPMTDQFRRRYPDLPEEKFVTIPNGFDPMDFAVQEDFQGERDPKKFTIVYTGSFYGEKQTPAYFLRAMKENIEAGGFDADSVVLRILGSHSAALQTQVCQLGLAQQVRVEGYASHARAVRAMQQADCLLLIIGSGRGSEVVFTGKIFEYLAARRPILALVPPGAASELIQSARAGMIVAPEDVAGISQALRMQYRQWKEGRLSIDLDNEVIQVYDRRRLAGQLAAELNQVLNRN